MAALAPLAVVNQSTGVSDADLADACTAYQVHLDRDFAPIHRTSREVQFYTKAQSVNLPADVDRLYAVDHCNQPGALGFHDDEKGHAVGYFGVLDDLQAGLPWESTMCHEGDELIGDRLCELTVLHLTGSGLFGRQVAELLARELNDACETIYYQVAGKSGKNWQMSDYVCAEWFTGDPSPFAHGGYSYTGAVKSPLQILPGGYIGVLPVRVTGQWNQITGEQAPNAALNQRPATWEHYQHDGQKLVPIVPPLLSRRRRRIGRLHRAAA